MNDSYTIKELIDGYRNKTYSTKDVYQYYKKRIDLYDHKVKSFLKLAEIDEITDALDHKNAIPVAHKDIYSTRNLETTAGSNILKGYIPPYDATSVVRLREKGFYPMGKVNLDAFAHGTTGENSDFHPTRNPYDLERVPGGSSSGSAAAVAAGFVPLATATDTGGSIRLPASWTNTVGIKPTYGRVSRYGVIAMTSSTDSIGHITKTVWDNAYVLNITAGIDRYDATTSNTPVPDYLDKIETGINGLKLGIPKEYIKNLPVEIKNAYDESIKKFIELGAIIVDNISLPHTDYALNAYYVITPSEISSNLARFDGIRFGHDRSHFGAEAKRRILIGTYCLSAGYYDAYYLKAQKVRTLVINDFKTIFKQVDALIAPVSVTMPPKMGELITDPLKLYMLDVLTVPINLAGVPSLAIPAGFHQGLPVGIQLIGDHFQEQLLYRAGYAFEQATEYYKTIPNIL